MLGKYRNIYAMMRNPCGFVKENGFPTNYFTDRNVLDKRLNSKTHHQFEFEKAILQSSSTYIKVTGRDNCSK